MITIVGLVSNCHLCNKQTLVWDNVNVYKARILLHCNRCLGCIPLCGLF